MDDNIVTDSILKDNEKRERLLMDFRGELVRLKEASSDFFEKQLIYISAGALGFSMLVIEKLFKDISLTHWKSIIIFSWTCFGAVLFINLLSHLYAEHLINKNISDLDNYKYDETIRKRIELRRFKIKLINIISALVLFIGIICFIIYTAINVYMVKHENSVTENTIKLHIIRPSPIT